MKEKYTTIHRPTKKYNAVGVARPPVASQTNYAATSYLPRATAINPSSIVNAYSLPPIQEAVIPIAVAAFPGFDIEIHPPEGETWPDAKLAEAQKGIRQADKVIKSLDCVRWAFYDTIGFRHSIFNFTLKTDGNWTLPATFQRLPAESFGKSPSAANDSERFWRDPLLQGIIQDRKDGSKHFYQSQSNYGEPVEVPVEELLHIFWELPGNQSVLSSILPTIDFWQFCRKCLGLSVQRQGVPNAVATFDLAAAQWFAENSNGTLTNGLPSNINSFMEEVVKSQSYGTAFNLPPGGNLTYPATSGAQAAQEIDQYIERKLLMHLIPTHVLDTLGSAISKSSAPALDLFIILANGWREIDARPFEQFYSNLLEINGFAGATCSFEWWPVVQADKVAEHNMAVADLVNGVAGINEVRAKTGYKELTPVEIDALIEERNKLAGTPGGML
jgi:hypothetical protein